MRIKKTEKVMYTVGADLVKNAKPKIIGKKYKSFLFSVFMANIKA